MECVRGKPNSILHRTSLPVPTVQERVFICLKFGMEIPLGKNCILSELHPNKTDWGRGTISENVFPFGINC